MTTQSTLNFTGTRMYQAGTWPPYRPATTRSTTAATTDLGTGEPNGTDG